MTIAQRFVDLSFNNQFVKTKLINNIKSWLGFGSMPAAQEGQWRGPFSGIGEQGTSFMLTPFEEGWQRNLSPTAENWRVSIVYACVMMTARAISQCEPKHLVKQADQGFDKSTTSPASRILRIPNHYETWPQIITNTVAEMLFGGECLWFVVRDERYAITQVHRVPRHSWSIYYEPESQEYFYQVNTNGELFSNPNALIPSRDTAHFRQHCPRHAMVGESPIAAAGLAIGLQVALNQSQLAFFSNMDRPSGAIQTDLELGKDQVRELRESFNEQTKRWNQGGTPILTHGLKFAPIGVAQSDAQLVEQQKLSALDIARVFGVPYALLGDSGGPQGGTEALITYWLSIGLGSVIENIERTLDRLFRLDQTERIELDPTPLLRVDQASLIDALGNAIQKGVMTPDEARARVRLSKVSGGDECYLQRQMTAMDLLRSLSENELANKATDATNDTDGTEPTVEDEEADTENEKSFDCEYAKSLVAQRLMVAIHE